MGYHYKESGYGGCDYLVGTKKGMEEGGIPKGIIFLTGQRYGDPNFRNWLEEKKWNNKYFIFPAKHCDDENELTHISEYGFVNRFGYFVTTENMFENGNSDYDIGKGDWFKRKNVNSFEDALKELD